VGGAGGSSPFGPLSSPAAGGSPSPRKRTVSEAERVEARKRVEERQRLAREKAAAAAAMQQ
jgi:hypothetical protein